MDRSWLKQAGDFLRGRKKVSLEDLGMVGELARELNDWLRSILPIGPEVVPSMSYEDAMGFFLDARPSDPRVVRGAMILQDHPQGRLLVQVFLDGNNDLVSDATGKPFGRRIIVRQLDEELTATFGGTRLVMVE
jgi:hypothetical protein